MQDAIVDPDTRNVEPILDSAFQEYGTPDSIRSDNGPPFASTGAGGLTRLDLWWQRLGIRHDRIEPGKPQQNGRLEQRAFDRFRHEYNDQRPHEALGLKPPARAYAPSGGRTTDPAPPAPPDSAHACSSAQSISIGILVAGATRTALDLRCAKTLDVVRTKQVHIPEEEPVIHHRALFSQGTTRR